MKKLRLNKDGTLKEREVKSISFDMTDPYEENLLNYAEEQGVFSRYIKRLIMIDMHGKQNPKTEAVFVAPVQDELKTEKAVNNMTSLL